MNSFTEPSPLKSRIGCIFLLTLLSSIVYFNSLQGVFQFDDRNLLSKEWLADIDSFNKDVKLGSFQNRPVLLWTFAVNNHLDNQHPFGFHLANLIIHILVTVLIFLILIRIKYQISNGYCFIKKENFNLIKNQKTNLLFIPFAVSLIFALHPLNTDSVTYISSRSSLLATFFYILTLYLFNETLLPFRTPKQKFILALLTIQGMYFSFASKLIAVTLPVILIFWFLTFFPPKIFPRFSKYFSIPKMIFVFGCGGILLIGFDHFFNVLYLPKDQGLELFGRIPYLMVQAKVIIFYYLKQYFLPFNLNIDTGFPFTQFSTDWKIAFSIIIIIGIILMVLKWGNVWVKLGSAWFFLTLAPTSTIVPLNDLAVEHRMYLPMSLGLCLITGWVISRFSKTTQVGSFIFIILVCGLLVTKRNQVWVSEIKLWSDSAIKNPHSPRVHNNLGKAYFEIGKLGIARAHLEKSVSSIPGYVKAQFNIENPKLFFQRKSISNKAFQEPNVSHKENILLKADFSEPHFNLASVYLDLGQLDDAEAEYRTALKLKPDYYPAELGMGSIKNKKKEYDLAIDHFLNSIVLMKKATGQPDYALARLNLGEVYGKTQQYNKAIVEFNRAIKENPSMFLAHFNLGTAHMLTGSNDKAELSFKACLNLKPNHEPALFNLARVYQNKKLWMNSNDTFKEFIKIKGPNPSVYSEMAWNNLMLEKIEQANTLYKKVLIFEPNHQVALFNLAKISYRLGKNKISRSYLERALQLDLPQSQAHELDELLKKLSNH